MFDKRLREDGEVRAYYYGLLVFPKLYGKKYQMKTYGEGMMVVIIAHLSEWLYEIPYKIVDKKGVEQKAWRVLSPCIRKWYSKDSTHLYENKTPDTVRVSHPK